MKRILIALLVMMTLLSMANAQNQNSASQDSTSKVKITVSKNNVGKTNTAVTVVGVDNSDADTTNIQTDSISISGATSSFDFDDEDDFPFNHFGSAVGGGILVAIIGIIAVFGLPVFIVFLIFFFRYKNRQARYRLAEQALAAGQPLPEGLINESKPTDQRSTGIRNTFTGIGLFVFLYAITGEFGIGAIGLLVMFMGIGQWLIDYKHENKNRDRNPEEKIYREKNQENNEESK